MTGYQMPLGIIDTVIVSGNEKTKAYVILDEMTLKPGEVATWGAMEYDKNRIYSLGLFNRVEMFYDSLDGLRFLFVDVHERWYLIPVPVFGFRDGDPKRPYYGAGILHNNFRGHNQKVYASMVFGYNPSLDLFFSDPQLSREHNLYFSGNLSFSRVRNRSKVESSITGDFDEKHYDVNTTLGKRFSLYETGGVNVGYHVVDVGSFLPGRTVSASGTDRYIYGRVNYTYDSRDLREYASQGRMMSLYAIKYGFGTSEVNFARFGGDVRGYFPLPLDVTLATRVHGTIVSGGLIPTYSRIFFGYGERIRGHYSTVFEGENMFGTSVELRYPILPSRTINFTALPIPQEFTVWRFGIGLAVFGDAGTVWFRGAKPGLRSFASGYGAGLDFLLPYSAVLRTSYARNERGKGQFILDLRGAF